jgi:hypothetical protein
VTPTERRAYMATFNQVYTSPDPPYTWNGPPGWAAIGYDITGTFTPSSFATFDLYVTVGQGSEPTWTELSNPANKITAFGPWEITFSANNKITTTEEMDVSFLQFTPAAPLWRSRFNPAVPCTKFALTGTAFDPAADYLYYDVPPYVSCQYETGSTDLYNYSARFEADYVAVDIWQFHGNNYSRVL